MRTHTQEYSGTNRKCSLPGRTFQKDNLFITFSCFKRVNDFVSLRTKTTHFSMTPQNCFTFLVSPLVTFFYYTLVPGPVLAVHLAFLCPSLLAISCLSFKFKLKNDLHERV